jgi:hypothetical protein
MPSTPIEPHGDIRNVTATIRQFFLGLVEAGFTESQALALTQSWVVALHKGATS